MKALKIFLVAAICLSVATTGFTQKTKTESFKVAGECGMCKKKIEKSAKEGGATFAAWDQQTKMLKVSYTAGTDVGAIQQRIADAGYDTPKYKASNEAYSNLDNCCQYDRQASSKGTSCCSSADCKMAQTEAVAKCVDMAACKDKGCCKDDAEYIGKGCCEKVAASAPGTKQ